MNRGRNRRVIVSAAIFCHKVSGFGSSSGNRELPAALDRPGRACGLCGIPVEDILDDYALFFHRGGGDFLRRYRETKGWNRQQLADHAKVGRTSIRCWENGQKTISQKCFFHLVENLGSDFPSMFRM